MTGRGPRVALVSIGIGRVQRGFERFFRGLFEVLKPALDITLYRSGRAEAAGERVPPLLRPATALVQRLPFTVGGGELESYRRDAIAYGMAMLPSLLRQRYDVVHCIDPPLCVVLERLRRVFPFGSRMIFTDGCVAPSRFYPPVDHVHHVGRVHLERAVAEGISGSHMTLIPVGTFPDRYAPSASRSILRRKYGIAPETFVILAVSAVKRSHKRVDHIIEEASRLDGNFLLWIDGNPEDPTLPQLAAQKLGSKSRVTHVPTEELPDLLASADVMVHAALEEAFGIAIVEALTAGVPVLVHDAPHFEWLVGDRECLVDMSKPGALAARLRDLRDRLPSLSGAGVERAALARRRFDWRYVGPLYAEMYRKVAALEGAVRIRAGITGRQPLGGHQSS